jgi:hypothetical protein
VNKVRCVFSTLVMSTMPPLNWRCESWNASFAVRALSACAFSS